MEVRGVEGKGIGGFELMGLLCWLLINMMAMVSAGFYLNVTC